MIAVDIAVSFIVIVVLQLIGMFIFSVITPFDDMEQLKKGNASVALAFGGKFLATAIILGTSAYSNASIWHVALWFAVGYVMLILTYLIFDWITPKFKLSEELLKGNVAIGSLLAFVYVGMGFSISSLIV